MIWLDVLLVLAALAMATALRPWRSWQGVSLPWPALTACVLLPLLWSVGGRAELPVLQPLSGSCLLMLMLGWPAAVLLVLPLSAGLLLAGVPARVALEHVVWLGLVPPTLAVLLGAALRRWLPNHLFVYILGRGFFATALALGLAGALSVWLHGSPPGVEAADLVLARGLAASGDAFITGMLVSIFVAFRPGWLATYADRIYLPRP
jgi:uncharacterized membrane protein